jgi:hypothetical protein
MRLGIVAGIGAALFVAGAALFLAGAFVWTNNARHGAISPAVYWGPGICIVGLMLLLIAGIVAWSRR